MEAHLLTLPGLGPLPEDWRSRRVPSFRRLLVIVRHVPPGSAISVALEGGHQPWTHTDELLDEIRRNHLGVRLKPGAPWPGPHPLSPLGRRTAEQAEAARQRRARKRQESLAREAARQARLAARREEGSP